MPHSDRVAQLYPKSLRSVSVASYYSQGYDGGIHPASTQTTQKTPRRLVFTRIMQSNGSLFNDVITFTVIFLRHADHAENTSSPVVYPDYGVKRLLV
jgi:hypothetical protein